jgi:hypothetical protein
MYFQSVLIALLVQGGMLVYSLIHIPIGLGIIGSLFVPQTYLQYVGVAFNIVGQVLMLASGAFSVMWVLIPYGS